MPNNPNSTPGRHLQSVNFCKALPKVKKVTLSTNLALIVCGVFILCLLGVNGALAWKNKGLKAELNSLNRVKQKADLNLRQLRVRYQEKSKELTEFNKKIRTKKQIEGVFKQALSKEREQYSRYFVLFSSLIEATVWLTSIQIKGQAHDIVLVGKALNAKGILQFVDRLNAQKLFMNAPYKIIQLERPDKKAKEYSFTIKTVGV